MANSIEKYQKDIDRLAQMGLRLAMAMQIEFAPETAKQFTIPAKELPHVRSSYELWYSEALAVVKQLLPDRAEDFADYYRSKAPRKEIRHSNYTMSDYLRGTTITLGDQTLVEPSAGFGPMHQQSNIVLSLRERFKSTLFDIRTLVQADLLDDELLAAEELNKKGFVRGAGAIAGVVLESHLAAVCERHGVKLTKKNPTIADLNDALRNAATIEIHQWRFVQHLGDLRNKCDHKKADDPTKEEVAELVEGVRKITKTVL